MFKIIRLIKQYLQVSRRSPHLSVKDKLSMVYAFTAINAVIGIVYFSKKGSIDLTTYYGLQSNEEKYSSSAVKWATESKLPEARVIQVSGLRVVDKYSLLRGKRVEDVQENVDEAEEEDTL